MEHPSRLTAFHHFCARHVVPLYEVLYNSQDFRVVNVPLMEQMRPSQMHDLQSSDSLVEEEFLIRQELATRQIIQDFTNNVLPFEIFSRLKLEPMEMLFLHYCELTMDPITVKARLGLLNTEQSPTKKPVKGNPFLSVPTFKSNAIPLEYAKNEELCAHGWVSIHAFVQMTRDFGVVPGFLNADKVFKVALHSTVQDFSAPATGSGVADAPERLSSRPTVVFPPSTTPPVSHKGRLFFANFVEALVLCVCECVFESLTHQDRQGDTEQCREVETVIREAIELMHIFGFNEPSRVLSHTHRPLKDRDLEGEKAKAAEGAKLRHSKLRGVKVKEGKTTAIEAEKAEKNGNQRSPALASKTNPTQKH